MTFPHYLELKFLEWQQKEGGRKTVKEFAAYIGVSQSTISMWWNEGRKPEGDNLRKLGEKLGIEVYDILNLPRPDSDLLYLQSVWQNLDPSKRRSLRELAERFITGKKK
jgi:transcriptional regulator with XRE-family HTH domain